MAMLGLGRIVLEDALPNGTRQIIVPIVDSTENVDFTGCTDIFAAFTGCSVGPSKIFSSYDNDKYKLNVKSKTNGYKNGAIMPFLNVFDGPFIMFYGIVNGSKTLLYFDYDQETGITNGKGAVVNDVYKPGQLYTDVKCFLMITKIEGHINLHAVAFSHNQERQETYLLGEIYGSDILYQEYGPNSEPSSELGDYIGTNDKTQIPPIPGLTALSLGMVKAHIIGSTEASSLRDKIFTQDFIENLVKTVEPIQTVIALNIIPNASTIKDEFKSGIILGNYNTNIEGYNVTDQIYDVNCGSIMINRYFGDFMDFNPYTKIELFLPYIGIMEISPDEAMGKELSVTYRIDSLSGSCLAFITIGGNIVYQRSGNLSVQIPLDGQLYSVNKQNVIMGTLSAGIGFLTGNPVAAASGASMLANEAVSVIGQKKQIAHASDSSMTVGYMGVQYPYLIITRPEQSKPENYKELYGYPSNITAKLQDLNGFTKVDNIHLDGIPATAQEINELYKLLREGVKIESGDNSPVVQPGHIGIYVNNHEQNTINKILTPISDINYTLLTPTSIINPVIQIEGTLANYHNANYVYIPDLDRKYFITDMTLTAGGIITMQLQVDVLDSFWNAYKGIDCIIERQENSFNRNLTDNKFKIYQRDQVTQIKFSGGLDLSDSALILYNI